MILDSHLPYFPSFLPFLSPPLYLYLVSCPSPPPRLPFSRRYLTPRSKAECYDVTKWVEDVNRNTRGPYLRYMTSDHRALSSFTLLLKTSSLLVSFVKERNRPRQSRSFCRQRWKTIVFTAGMLQPGVPQGEALLGIQKKNVFQLHITWSYEVILPFRSNRHWFDLIFLIQLCFTLRIDFFFSFWFASTSLSSLGLMTASPCLCRRSPLFSLRAFSSRL